MAGPSGNTQIVFNGEIYNFQSLRKELEGLGHHFHTQSDTEVILAAYQQWDTACVEHFRGMFAFAIWDVPRKRLFLTRDRVGKKNRSSTPNKMGVFILRLSCKAYWHMTVSRVNQRWRRSSST